MRKEQLDVHGQSLSEPGKTKFQEMVEQIRNAAVPTQSDIQRSKTSLYFSGPNGHHYWYYTNEERVMRST